TLFLTNNIVGAGASNYSGVTNVNQGIVQAQPGIGNTPFGSSAAVVVANGATVQLAGSGISLARPLVLEGTGVNGAGALENVSGTNTWSGTVTLNTSSTVGTDVGQLT